MAIIYRVEQIQEDGARIGAYKSGLNYTAGLDAVATEQHPLPGQDAGLAHWYNESYTLDYYFGFETLEHYKHWFLHEDGRYAMAEEGGVVSVYEVADHLAQFGQFQAMFHKESAVHLYDLHTGTLEKLRG